MKILELSRAYDRGPLALNVKHIVSIEPVIVTNPQYTGDAKTFINTVNKIEYMVIEDYDSIMKALMAL